MGDEQTNKLAVSPHAREKCIKRARKSVALLDKWGYWSGIGYLVLGLVCIGIVICFIVLLQHIAQMPGNPQQVQNNMWEGFLLGIIFGFLTGYLVYKSAFCFFESIKFFRGDPMDRILLEYHEALLNLMHNQENRQSCEKMPESEEPLL
jgi:hypothetical protein